MTSDINLQSHSILVRVSRTLAVSLQGLSQSVVTICLTTCTNESFPMRTEILSQLSLFLWNSVVAYRQLLPLQLTLTFTGSYRVSLAGVRRSTQISLQHSVNFGYNVHLCGFHTVQAVFNKVQQFLHRSSGFCNSLPWVTFTPKKSSTAAES